MRDMKRGRVLCYMHANGSLTHGHLIQLGETISIIASESVIKLKNLKQKNKLIELFSNLKYN